LFKVNQAAPGFLADEANRILRPEWEHALSSILSRRLAAAFLVALDRVRFLDGENARLQAERDRPGGQEDVEQTWKEVVARVRAVDSRLGDTEIGSSILGAIHVQNAARNRVFMARWFTERDEIRTRLAAADAENGRLREAHEAWRGFAEHLEHCVECGQMSPDDCFDGGQYRDAAKLAEEQIALAARAPLDRSAAEWEPETAKINAPITLAQARNPHLTSTPGFQFVAWKFCPWCGTSRPSPGAVQPPTASAGLHCRDCGTVLDAGEAKIFTVCDSCWGRVVARNVAAAVGDRAAPVLSGERAEIDALLSEYGDASVGYALALRSHSLDYIGTNTTQEDRLERHGERMKQARARARVLLASSSTTPNLGEARISPGVEAASSSQEATSDTREAAWLDGYLAALVNREYEEHGRIDAGMLPGLREEAQRAFRASASPAGASREATAEKNNG
jgi:hypothetical protein